MTEITSIGQMDGIIESGNFVLFYLSRPDCGACGAVKPKLEELCKAYPELETYHVDLDINEIIAGQYSVFTIPGILVFAGGKEALREARNFSLKDIDRRLARLHNMMFA